MKCAQCGREIGDMWLKLEPDGFDNIDLTILFCSYLCLLQYVTLRISVSDYTEYLTWFAGLQKSPRGVL